MYTYYIWIIVLITSSVRLSAQTINDKNLIEEILQRLTPYYKTSLPVIKFEPGIPAESIVGKNQTYISIAPGLFDVLRNNGFQNQEKLKAVLAFILAHELAHHELHSTALHSTKTISSEIKKQFEIEADNTGYFTAILADYPLTPDLVRELFTILYQKYPGLNTANYPDLVTRLNATQETIQAIYESHLPSLFQAAAFLFVQGQYPESVSCLRHIYEDYPNEKISNTIALNYLSAYFKTQPAHNKQNVFKYPIDFNLEDFRSFSMPPFDSPQSLIKRAKYHLESEALAKNPDYPTTRINLAITHLANQSRDNAQSQINRISTPLSPAAQNIQAILYAYEDNPFEAKKIFETLASQGNLTARYNLIVLNQILNRTNLQSFVQALQILSIQEIADICKFAHQSVFVTQSESQVLSPNNEIRVMRSQNIIWPKRKSSFQKISESPSLSIDFLIDNEIDTPYQKLTMSYKDIHTGKYKIQHILIVKPSFKGKSGLGIAVGDTAQKVLQTYGKPDPGTNTHLQSDVFYQYDDARIIFEIKNNKVSSWIWYWEMN